MQGLTIKDADGSDLLIDYASWDGFAGRVRGEVILTGDAEYEDARKVWNAMIDRRPAVIVRCVDADDVVACVRLTAEHRLRTSVRGGGHNVAGNAVNDGGLVIDLSRMRGVAVDGDRRTVRVQGGATLGDVDRETQKFGLATPLGVVPPTGVAGLALHGGLGWLLRRYGTSADNIISAEIVTADGRLRTASEHEDPDLLWALRGGGGNFGVVTSFEFMLHPVGPTIWAGLVMYSLDDMPEVLAAFQKRMAGAPDELTANIMLWTTPPLPSLPPGIEGRPSLMVNACYCGPLENGERVLSPLKMLGRPLADLSRPLEFLKMQDLGGTFGNGGPSRTRNYWKSIFINDLGPEVVEILRSATVRRPSERSSISIYYLGGAYARVKAEEAAFDNRDQRFLVSVEATWTEPVEDDANISWVRGTFDAVRKGAQARVYLNFAGFAEEKDIVERSFGENMARLRDLKARYDPMNLFRGHLAVQPAVSMIVTGPTGR
jgi:hypothetical protein